MSASKAIVTIARIINYGKVPWVYMRNTALDSANISKSTKLFLEMLHTTPVQELLD